MCVGQWYMTFFIDMERTANTLYTDMKTVLTIELLEVDTMRLKHPSTVRNEMI